MRARRRIVRYAVLGAFAALLLPASEHHGQVKFGGLPVPGATVTIARDDKKFTAITDAQGAYLFADLPDGAWMLTIEMPGFATVRQEIAVVPQAPGPEWELRMLPLDEIQAVTPAPTPAAPAAETKTAAPPPKQPKHGKNLPVGPTNTQSAFQRADLNAANPAPDAPGNDSAPPGNDGPGTPAELSQRAADGLLINGTTNNGASSPFAQAQAFGNNRRGARSLYTGSLGFIMDNSALDAAPYSVTGKDTGKPGYNNFRGVAAFGGPLKIPRLVPRNGPQFFFNYQWTRNRTDSTLPGAVPDALERSGDFSKTVDAFGNPVQIHDPTSPARFSGNVIPAYLISRQAQTLLNLDLYPLPNFAGGRYNYQVATVGITHQDALQTRMNKLIGRKNQVSGLFAMQDSRADNQNLFGFLDTSDSLGLTLNLNWRHNITQRFFANLGFQYSRMALRTKPYFANRANISGDAGILGNNQEPLNWGPPALQFASGITPLTDGLPSFTRNQAAAVSLDSLWNRGRHNVSFGGDVRRQQFNLFSQQDPRGQFTFTGAASGFDFADFLLGVPDTSSIAFGNADKYLRASSYDAYVVDDWRMSPGLTLNVGVRWEYWSPITEKYGRLANLDIMGPFTAEAPVLALDPTGLLTGRRYPDSLLQPDKHAFQPRVGFSWRPFPASSMVVRGGYGIYYNTSVYLPIAMQMLQQAAIPGTKSLVVPNPDYQLTLADGFKASSAVTADTFGVDPNFRIGYSQNWQLSVQRDLPGSLVITAMYQGSKGTRGLQEFLPNTYAPGAANPCPLCPSGFVYVASNGNSSREAGVLQLRRRLRSGPAASLQYTYSKSIDDDALLGGGGQLGLTAGPENQNPGGGQGNPGGTPGAGGSSPTGQTGASATPAAVAQNWLNLRAERSVSNFDQRHAISFLMQYTTGMGLHGGALVNGWRGALFKQWTALTQITAGTGLPLTPVYPVPSGGTGVTGFVRPQVTGAPLYAAPSGLYLNPAAFAPPPAGQWGNAGRNSITGPAQFVLSASLGRTFQVSDRLSLDLRVDANNALNHVTFPSWNTTVGGGVFGLPPYANAMRNMQTTLRLRF
ncbi:MAG TPA: TonB-dependent receptor [Bryobacteraceae bacterium]|nr:TonB-dependent receptor [Bryobacteraceae bacterium]